MSTRRGVPNRFAAIVVVVVVAAMIAKRCDGWCRARAVGVLCQLWIMVLKLQTHYYPTDDCTDDDAYFAAGTCSSAIEVVVLLRCFSCLFVVGTVLLRLTLLKVK